MRFSSPGLVFIRGEALGAIYHISEHGCTYSFKIQTALVLSVIQIFCFLASYRPSSRNRGTVSGTQTGLSKTFILI